MDKNMTLQQGIEQFHAKNMKYFSVRSTSKKGKEFLRCHDVAHVVFGCDTTIYGEGVVKIWTTFGTTLSFWKVIHGYNEANAFKLFKMYSLRHMVENILQFIIVIPKVIIRTKRMSKPWPFSVYSPYLNTTLSEIRSEFNIQII